LKVLPVIKGIFPGTVKVYLNPKITVWLLLFTKV